MISMPARLISAKVTLYLAAALLVSLAGNAWLFWQLAQAKPEAALKCVQGALEATVEQDRKEDARDESAGEIGREVAERNEQAEVAAQTETDTAKEKIRYVYRDRPVPAGAGTAELDPRVRDQLETLRQRANAPEG